MQFSNTISFNQNYIDEIKNQPHGNFSILSLNINSFCKKIIEVNEILNTRLIDLCVFQESRLDSTIPLSFFQNSNYKSFRCDRNKAGGGTILFVKKENSIVKFKRLVNFLILNSFLCSSK